MALFSGELRGFGFGVPVVGTAEEFGGEERLCFDRG
jgi:hypothetical protein